MPTQVESTSPLASSPVNRETSAQNQHSPALSASRSVRLNAVSKRRTKKVAFTSSPEFMERAGQLGVAERHILRDYAGDTAETRILALRKMESYRRRNNNQPPIMQLDSQSKSWKCMICHRSEPFFTFQRIALHVTSTHWQLSSWPCPMKSCPRSYRALDQLRRHKKSHRSEEWDSTGSTPPPVSSPPPRPRTIAVDESQFQSCLFIEPPDGITQAATSSGSAHLGSGFRSAKLSFEQPLGGGIPQLQPLASSAFDLSPPPLSFPVLNEFDFLGKLLPGSDHANPPSTSTLTNVFPVNLNNAGQQVRLTGLPQYGQTNATNFPLNQGFSPSNTDQDTHWYNDTTFRHAGTSFSPVAHANDLSMSYSSGRVNRGGANAPWFPRRSTISQTGPSSSSASNNLDLSMAYSAPPMYSRSNSTPQNEMRRRMSRVFPASARLYGTDFVDSGEELGQDAGQSPGRWLWGS